MFVSLKFLIILNILLDDCEHEILNYANIKYSSSMSVSLKF